MNIIDRRLNPKGKSLANRQRFLRRARRYVREAVRKASAERRIADIGDGERISIPADGLSEPMFRPDESVGRRDIVLPGNKKFVEGDRIRRPGGGAGRGSRASPDGEGEDSFHFVLSRDEFLDIFLDDLELPDLAKKTITKSDNVLPARAGYSVSGSPSNLNLVRTMRNSLSRRIALNRPRPEDIRLLRDEIAELEASENDPVRLDFLRRELERQLRRTRVIPFIDPVDVRFNRFEMVPKPATQAVMFCLMDVSGSMTEHMKDLAKRFFMLLYLFIARRYRDVDIVFIRHTHHAQEVDEETFFHSTESGGTVVSTALEEMKRVVASRYPTDDWNIYAAQASDGDNIVSDNPRLLRLLENDILPLCQYFAYLEVGEETDIGHPRETNLWLTYEKVADPGRRFAMRRVRNRGDIFPVFRNLFARDQATVGGSTA
jgi:hypothetical protein